MNFSDALHGLRSGRSAQRAGWNGQGMYVFLARAGRLVSADGGVIQQIIAPCLVLRTADGSYVPGWLASQTDLLADDWDFCG